MDAITYTQARKNFSFTMDRFPITRQNSAPVVMISLEDYNAIEETLYLMRSPKNYSRLLKSIENVKKHRVKAKTIIEDSDAAV